MEEALRTLRPLRRTNSLPGGLSAFATGAHVYSLPTALEEALVAPRQLFGCYVDGMKVVDRLALDPPAAAAAAEIVHEVAVTTTDDLPHASSQSSDTSPHVLSQLSLPESDAEMTALPHPKGAEPLVLSRHTLAAVQDGVEVHADAAPEEAKAEDTNEATQPPVAVPNLIPYDPLLMAEWLVTYRQCRTHCPAGITKFLQDMHQQPSHAGSPASPKSLCSSSRSIFNPRSSMGLADPHTPEVSPTGNFLSAAEGVRDTPLSGKMALEALGSLWEGRKDIPIPMASGFRRKGLFGDAERKELHQMVIAVLNKVTSDASKFREVKNELMRLPIPEASPEQLSSVVDVFFLKAVREPHFSHCYADLIAALCKIPEGHHLTGDKRLSLEYRLRHALIKRCQKEFVASVENERIDEETSKEQRDLMCGNVRFICELFLREMVTDAVFTVILTTCCTGSEFGTFIIPPVYTPTESQMDQVMTVLQAVGRVYFAGSLGQDLFPRLEANLSYWLDHYPISRCRYLLISRLEELKSFRLPVATTRNEGPLTPYPQQASFSPFVAKSPPLGPRREASAPESRDYRSTFMPTLQSSGSMSQQGSPPLVMVGSHVVAPLSVGTVAAPLATDAAAKVKSMSSIMVGGRPLPVPRSSLRHPSAGASVSVNSLSAQETPRIQESLSRTNSLRVIGDAASSEAAVPPASAAAAATADVPRPFKPEHIVKDMVTYNCADSVLTAEALGQQWITRYGDVHRALRAWTDRCLSIVREEKSRLRTGPLMAALLATGAATRDEMRDIAFASLQSTVESGLHEDLPVFKFWAQLVLSDPHRVVMDELLLEYGLEYLLDCAPDAVRSYLADVGGWHQHVQKTTPMAPADESCRFARYRPLLLLQSCYPAPKGPEMPELMAVDFPEVRSCSLEAEVFCALLSGAPTAEALFATVRVSPRLPVDSSLAAELFSAVLLAQLHRPRQKLLEECMPLLQTAVDGADRRDREVALCAEVFEILMHTTIPLVPTAGGNTLSKLREAHILSDETIERLRQHYGSVSDGPLAVDVVFSTTSPAPASVPLSSPPTSAGSSIVNLPSATRQQPVDKNASAPPSPQSSFADTRRGGGGRGSRPHRHNSGRGARGKASGSHGDSSNTNNDLISPSQSTYYDAASRGVVGYHGDRAGKPRRGGRYNGQSTSAYSCGGGSAADGTYGSGTGGTGRYAYGSKRQ